MYRDKSTTSLPTCGSKSNVLFGCRSATRPANLLTAANARCFARHRTTWKHMVSLRRKSVAIFSKGHVGTAAPGSPPGGGPPPRWAGGGGAPGVFWKQKRTPGGAPPFGTAGGGCPYATTLSD